MGYRQFFGRGLNAVSIRMGSPVLRLYYQADLYLAMTDINNWLAYLASEGLQYCFNYFKKVAINTEMSATMCS